MDPTVDFESFNSIALPVHILLQHEQLVPVPWPGLELGPEHEIVLQAVPAVGPSLLDAMLDDQVEGTGMAAVPTSWVSETHSTNNITIVLDLFYHCFPMFRTLLHLQKIKLLINYSYTIDNRAKLWITN